MRILPLFIPHQGCPYSCIYCNQYSITKADFGTRHNFSRLIAEFCSRNETIDKEIAFLGGTFTALDIDNQIEYLQMIKPYLSKLRGIRISTRPDYIDQKKLEFLKKWGVSTIELGIQSFNDKVLKAARRGYSGDIAEAACQQVKKSKTDLIIQLMPGLPEDTRSSYMESLDKAIFIQPQGLRLYPTIVLRDTALEQDYLLGGYKPLSIEEAINWLVISVQRCRAAAINIIKMGLHSDLKPAEIVAGPYHPAIGELVKIEVLFEELKNNWQPGMTLVIPANWKSMFLGHQRSLIKKLKDKLLLDKIAVRINKDKKTEDYCFDKSIAHYIW